MDGVQATRFLGFAAKVLVVVLPAFATSYFSYRSSAVESESKAQATKIRAEAGYLHLVARVDEMQKALLDEQRYSSQLEGRIQGIEGDRRAAVRPTESPPAGAVGLGAAGALGHGAGGGHRTVRPAPPLKPPVTIEHQSYKPRHLPRNLEEALQQKL